MAKENTIPFYEELISSKTYLPIAGDKIIDPFHPNGGGWLVMSASNCKCNDGIFLIKIKWIGKNLIESNHLHEGEEATLIETMSPFHFIEIMHDHVIKSGWRFVSSENDEKRFIDMIGWSIRTEYLKEEDDVKKKRTLSAIDRLKDLGWSDDDIKKEIQQRTDLISEYFSERYQYNPKIN
jgi:hypothetical protein